VRKIITGVIAVAMLAVPTVANAAVAVSPDGTGFVGKGDVQNALGLANDAEMQAKFKSDPDAIKFTAKQAAKFDWSWQCADGNTYHWIYNVAPTVQPVDATANTNAAGKLTNGWNLTGLTGTASPAGESTIEGRQMFTCPDGSFSTVNFPMKSGTTTTLQVNGHDLPNTPIVDPAPVA
jgi:hypothetical protein